MIIILKWFFQHVDLQGKSHAYVSSNLFQQYYISQTDDTQDTSWMFTAVPEAALT